MPPLAPPDEVLGKIKTLVEYVINHGADKEQIAREAIEKNKFDFLSARRDSIGFVCYEYMKGEKLRARKEERDAKRREGREGKEEDGGGGKKSDDAEQHAHKHKKSGGKDVDDADDADDDGETGAAMVKQLTREEQKDESELER